MIERAKVIELLDDDRAEVAILRDESCGDCKICHSLNPGKPYSLIADNTVGARPGETVKLEITPRRMIGLSLLVFGLPVAAFIVGYLLLSLFVDTTTTAGTGLAVGGGLLFLAGAFWTASRYDRRRRRPLVRLIERLEEHPDDDSGGAAD